MIMRIPDASVSAGEHRQKCPRADIWAVSQPLLMLALHRIPRFAFLGYICLYSILRREQGCASYNMCLEKAYQCCLEGA